MRKILLIGRTGAGKTTLTQALKGEKLDYKKTQYINFQGALIDTPGEYIETKHLGYAIALYAYEADVVGLLMSSTEPFSLYPPNVTGMVNREVVGIVTKIDDPEGRSGTRRRLAEADGLRKNILRFLRFGRGDRRNFRLFEGRWRRSSLGNRK